MDEYQRKAYGTLLDAVEMVSRLIVHARSTGQPLCLPVELVDKLVEGQQALFAAHRMFDHIGGTQ
jgi:hypothetical protein